MANRGKIPIIGQINQQLLLSVTWLGGLLGVQLLEELVLWELCSHICLGVLLPHQPVLNTLLLNEQLWKEPVRYIHYFICVGFWRSCTFCTYLCLAIFIASHQNETLFMAQLDQNHIYLFHFLCNIYVSLTRVKVHSR